ncbi:hypothetical protein M422DRAFT_33897 [Sphaerobolus stellatus SS14]|uniref:Uncharacterized protein n=1 Tax=Sphaerobolus stellatus (strain SS14) TaxID=990650 RepID=A0A0C9UR27_SPHS4|nr:hypothetical protein M422DRAFT_33897 [Sphaerobolus stellatus SS14]
MPYCGLHSVKEHSLIPNDKTRDIVKEYIWEYVQRCVAPQWFQRLLGDQPMEYEEYEAVVSSLAIDRAIFPCLSPPAWMLQECIRRALKAGLGYQVSWRVPDEERNGDIEGDQKTLQEMVPPEEAYRF